jgi:hypothetical protein
MENKETQGRLAELSRLRDEIRVQLHLAGMDARSFWEEIEPKLADLERKLERGVDATAKYANVIADELAGALEKVRDRFAGDDAS